MPTDAPCRFRRRNLYAVIVQRSSRFPLPQSDRCPIALLTAHVTTRTKIVPVANPTRRGPLWEMVEVRRKAWR
jgi:hypothetical protein